MFTDLYRVYYQPTLSQGTSVTYSFSLFIDLIKFISTGNAKIQGLTTQLDLTGNRYNLALVRDMHVNSTVPVNVLILY